MKTNQAVRLSMLVGAALVASSISPGFSAPLTVNSYDMINGNGQAVGGRFNYWDGTYNGTGSTTTDNAPLSGGTGALTDGVIATERWDAVSNYAGTGQDVLWFTSVSGNPLITFNLAGTPTVSSVNLYIDDSNYGNVGAPSSINVDGTNYIPTLTQISPYDAELTISGLSLVGPLITVQPIASTQPLIWWIAISDVQFNGVATQVGATPLPPTAILFATGLGAMGLFGWRRKQRSAAGMGVAMTGFRSLLD
jgi:hypothetical protein